MKALSVKAEAQFAKLLTCARCKKHRQTILDGVLILIIGVPMGLFFWMLIFNAAEQSALMAGVK